MAILKVEFRTHLILRIIGKANDFHRTYLAENPK